MISTDVNNSLDKEESGTSHLELYYAIERERKNRFFTMTGILLVVLGLLIFGAGIFFRLTYNPDNFGVSAYRPEFLYAYTAGLSGIIVGGLLDIGGWVILGLKR